MLSRGAAGVGEVCGEFYQVGPQNMKGFPMSSGNRIHWLAVTLSLAACGLASTVAHGEMLRWKFKQGETMNYVMDRAIDGKIDLSGSQIEFTSAMTFDTSWKIKSVGSDGAAEVEQTVDRVQMKMDSPLGGGLDYDSKKPGSGQGQIWEMMGPMFEALVGQTFSLKVTPTGKVSDIKMPEKVTEQLAKQGGPGGRRGGFGFGGGMLTESSIKEMIERSFVPLPEKDIAPDVTWSQSFSNAMRGAGVTKSAITYSAGEKESKDGHKIQKISAKTELTFEPEENSQVDVEISEQEGMATIYFDVDAGRTLKVEGKQKQVMEISAPNREITQEVTEKVTVRQGKSPEPKSDDTK
ncbi:MAG: hypothetical protein HYX69_14245 [Planctomycetia bacterium]|nr:hypothetical protein [Planctomycetia bacterium]